MEDFKFENGWDYYSFKICECYLSALINDDSSGLEDEEQALFDKWEKDMVGLVKDAETFHWDCGNDSYIGIDDVSGFMADVVDIRLVFKDNKKD